MARRSANRVAADRAAEERRAAARTASRARAATEPLGRGRGEEVRLKLLKAAIDVFGRHGFDGASTRMLTRAAGVNLQAIPYYFGGKEGLYLAVADHIAELIAGRVGPLAARIAARSATSPAEARAALIELGETMAGVLVSEDAAHWARFIVAEQMEPTEAFERMFGRIMAPLLATARGLIGVMLHADPESEEVRLRAVALFGQVLVFRVARAAVLRALQWKDIGAREFDAIRGVVRRAVDAIAPGQDEAAP